MAAPDPNEEIPRFLPGQLIAPRMWLEARMGSYYLVLAAYEGEYAPITYLLALSRLHGRAQLVCMDEFEVNARGLRLVEP